MRDVKHHINFVPVAFLLNHLNYRINLKDDTVGNIVPH